MKIVEIAMRGPTYDFREEGGSWTVYDCQSGCAAALNGTRQVGLGLNEANDLAAVLNRVELQRVSSRNADRLNDSNGVRD